MLWCIRVDFPAFLTLNHFLERFGHCNLDLKKKKETNYTLLQFITRQDVITDILDLSFCVLQLLSRILNFLLPFVITIFCGHIGNAELAGYALASAVPPILCTHLY